MLITSNIGKGHAAYARSKSFSTSHSMRIFGSSAERSLTQETPDHCGCTRYVELSEHFRIFVICGWLVTVSEKYIDLRMIESLFY